MNHYKALGGYARVLTAFKPNNELTMHQIALRLNASYGWTHTTCQSMIHRGLLQAKHVGSAILCTPNPRHPLIPLLNNFNAMLKKLR